jgi:hypothetical protein
LPRLLKSFFRRLHPAAARTLGIEDVPDSSFVDELEGSGCIEELYE